MHEKRKLSVVALGALVCSMVSAAPYAQDKWQRCPEQPQIIKGHSPEAAAAKREATAATPVAGGEVVRENVAGRDGIEVQLLSVVPSGKVSARASDLAEYGDRTEVVVTLTEAPPDLVGPSLVAEIHEGTCVDLKSAPVRSTEESPAVYSLAPSVFSLRSFGAVLPVSFAVLQSSAHAIEIRTDPEGGIAPYTCVDV